MHLSSRHRRGEGPPGPSSSVGAQPNSTPGVFEGDRPGFPPAAPMKPASGIPSCRWQLGKKKYEHPQGFAHRHHLCKNSGRRRAMFQARGAWPGEPRAKKSPLRLSMRGGEQGLHWFQNSHHLPESISCVNFSIFHVSNMKYHALLGWPNFKLHLLVLTLRSFNTFIRELKRLNICSLIRELYGSPKRFTKPQRCAGSLPSA